MNRLENRAPERGSTLISLHNSFHFFLLQDTAHRITHILAVALMLVALPPPSRVRCSTP